MIEGKRTGIFFNNCFLLRIWISLKMLMFDLSILLIFYLFKFTIKMSFDLNIANGYFIRQKNK